LEKPKPKKDNERRQPGPKNKRPAIPEAFKIDRRLSPMANILREAENTQIEPDNESQELASETTLPPPNTTNAIGTSLPQIKPQPIAPQKDFAKVANSITREALPAGFFSGKSKQIYDYLYSQTRGAIVPKRSVRKSIKELMIATKTGSDVTIRRNLVKLIQVGLIIVNPIGGSHEGNEYSVILPEELTPSTSSTTSTPSTSSTPSHFLPVVPLVESTSSTRGTSVKESMDYVTSKTLFKTHDDDDGVNQISEAIRQVSRELLGAELPVNQQERERWRQCGELLAEELRRAAARAGNVSSVSAFFTTHLKRRLKSGPSVKNNEQPNRELMKSQAKALSKETQLLKMKKELQQLHTGDPSYTKKELTDDLRFRCERSGIEWDENLVNKILGVPDNSTEI
jgi:hypothetical protein